MKRSVSTIVAVLSLLSLTALATRTAQAEGGAGVYDPKSDPVKDVQAATRRAKAEHKRILLDVGGEWCSWCHTLDRTLAGEKTLADLVAADYLVVKVNFSPENENEAFLKGYPEIKGFPHLFVLDENGKLLHSQETSLLEQGKGYDVKKVEEFLRKWAR